MKLRWFVIGIVAAAAGSMFMIKHFVEDKKATLDFVDNTNEKNFSKFSHEILETEFDDTEFLD
jgi:hypothetical protein